MNKCSYNQSTQHLLCWNVGKYNHLVMNFVISNVNMLWGQNCLMKGSGEVDSKYRIEGIVMAMVFAVPATATSGTLVILPPIC